MGICASCCGGRRRTKHTDPERQPLLGNINDNPPKNAFEKVADVAAALKAGKLPSQEQFAAAVRVLLNSNALQVPVLKTSNSALSQDQIRILEDVRVVLDATLRWTSEKNDDNLIQKLIYEARNLSSVPVHLEADVKIDPKVETIASAIPSEAEVKTDTSALIQSVQTLAQLVLTSSTFRLLLFDVFETGRELFADALVQVEQVAEQVNETAVAFEDAIRPGGAPERVAEKRKADIPPPPESHDLKKAVLDRIEKVIRQAQASPAYNSSLRTILYIVRKYSHRVKVASAAIQESTDEPIKFSSPVLIPDPAVRRLLSYVQTILERVASNTSLDPLLNQLYTTISSIVHTPTENASSAKQYFDRLGGWLDRALAEPEYVTSQQGQEDAQVLYDDGRRLLDSDGVVSSNLKTLLAQAEAFLQGIRDDRQTNLVINSIDTLAQDISKFTQTAVEVGADAAVHWKREVVRAAFGWFVPKILQALKAIPMPRFEMTSDEIDVAVDSMLLTAGASLVPDTLVFREWAEIRVTHGTEIENVSRVRLHIDGLRLNVNDVGYYAWYKHGGRQWLGYEDDGLLTFAIGHPESDGEGLSLDVELETSLGTSTAGDPIFKVIDVGLDVPGLSFSIRKSRHWLLNNLVVNLFAGPAARMVIKFVLKNQITTLLESLETSLRGLKIGVQEESNGRETHIRHIWDVLLRDFGSFSKYVEGEEEEEDNEEEEPQVHTETSTSFNPTGIVRTTVTQPEPTDDVEPTETNIAIGVGPQLLPGKAQPEPPPDPKAIAREAIGEIHDAVETAKDETIETVQGTVEEARDLRREAQLAGQRLETRQKYEKAQKGWKSRVFNL